MLTVHHLGVSQSERIVWLCEELEIPYALKVYARDPQTMLAPPEYKALHPMGIAPVITGDGLTLGESGAIMEYILQRYGQGRLVVAPDAPNFPDYLFWFHFANGTLMPSEMSAWVASALDPDGQNPLGAIMKDRSAPWHQIVEQRLGQARYFAGDAFTAADIIMVFGLTTMRAFTGQKLDSYPNTRAYLARIGERPAYCRAMKKGDPSMTPMLS